MVDDDFGPEDIRMGEEVPVDTDRELRLRALTAHESDGLPLQPGQAAVFEGVASERWQPLSLSSHVYTEIDPVSASEGSGWDVLQLVGLDFDGAQAWPTLPEPFATFEQDCVPVARPLPELHEGTKVRAEVRNIADEPIEVVFLGLVGVRGWPVAE